jgi:glyoxylase-like metal-dependent hydrolase (beta-lactamase superfamily II)
MGHTEINTSWQEVGPRTYVRANPVWGMNTGLVIGDERALVVDTGAGPRQAEDILAAVRTLTDLPLIVANTHAHFDHFFGNALFRRIGAAEIWAHSNAAAAIAAGGEGQRRHVAEAEPDMAGAAGPDTDIVVPDRLVADAPVDLDLGGHTVTLFHLGPGHTDGDLLIGSGSVLFAGDLLEEGADPSFDDAFPREWVGTLGKVGALDDLYDTFIPGHGQPVTAAFVSTQKNKMRQAIRVAAMAVQESVSDATKAIPIMPYGPEQSRALIERLRASAH